MTHKDADTAFTSQTSLTHTRIYTHFDSEMPLGLLCHYQVTNDLVSGCYIKMEYAFQSWREQTLKESLKTDESQTQSVV